MDNGQRADGCFEGTAYYTRLPKYTPYIDAPEGLDRHIVDIFTIMSGYPVSKEVQDAVRDHSVFEDLDHVGVHIKHAIHTRKSQHVRLPWKSLDITGMITDDVVDPMDNLKHLVGPVTRVVYSLLPLAIYPYSSKERVARSHRESDASGRASSSRPKCSAPCYCSPPSTVAGS